MTGLPPSEELGETFGDIDIYLFDQLLKGRFDRRSRVLDAGCGDGRNLIYLLRRGFSCCGVDRDAGAVERVRHLVGRTGNASPPEQFQVGEIDALPFPSTSLDAVICSAVLHFARDTAHFQGMVDEMWRVLAASGLLLARLASNIGLESVIGPAGRRARLPDGSDRFIVDESMLTETTRRLGGKLLDPIKTTVVAGQRCMTTWCLEKVD